MYIYMCVNSTCHVRTPQGQDIPTKTEMEYLGTILCADGTSGNENFQTHRHGKGNFFVSGHGVEARLYNSGQETWLVQGSG